MTASGAHGLTAFQRHGLAMLEPPEQWSLGNAESRAARDVEPARALVLDDCVPDVGTWWSVARGWDPGTRCVHSLAGPKRPHLDLVREPPMTRATAMRSRRAQRRLTRAQRRRLQHAGQAEDVIGVAVGDQNVVDEMTTELALVPLAAVDQDANVPRRTRRLGAAMGRSAPHRRCPGRACSGPGRWRFAGSGDARRNLGHARAAEVALGQHRPGAAQEDVEPEDGSSPFFTSRSACAGAACASPAARRSSR